MYQRKLWHQLSLKLEQFVALAVFQAGDTLIQLYHNFITDFETKINLLKLAHFAVTVSRQYSEKEAAIGYLEGVAEKLLNTKETRIEEPILYIKLQIALFNLELGDQKECKKLLEQGNATLDSMTDVDPSVYASYYWVSSQYHKTRQEFAEFYKSALLYLAYISVDSLSESFKLDLAFDLSLSALLGDNIYNFGELLAHPIITVQQRIEQFHLSVTAERTKLSVEDVEYLLIKSLSVHLIEGIIDQVEGTVHVSWVQPRVLGITQVKSLRDRLDNWVDKVHTALLSVEAETPDLVAS
ncbi:unnamed protein product [Withania somnifera]